MNATVEESTVKNNLCVSCGICVAACARNCIALAEKDGQYIPIIDHDNCNHCGVCSSVCSAHRDEYHKLFGRSGQPIPPDMYTGNYLACYNASAIDEKTQFDGASGGCITTFVRELLAGGLYDLAFLVDTFSYDTLVETKPYGEDDDLSDTSKSRYIPVSHQKMAEYVLTHRDEKIIVIATSCVVHTFLNLLDTYNLDRSNYLILGLFCDKVFNYNIFAYFQTFDNQAHLDKLYFKSKEQTGWPGNVKLIYTDGTSSFLPASERMMAKQFFQLERCLYCIDKLNVFSDISFGDNFTGENTDLKGCSTLICRTKKGEEVLRRVAPRLQLDDIDMERIAKGQNLQRRAANLEYAKMYWAEKGINIYPDLLTDSTVHITRKYKEKIKDIHLGRIFPKKKKKILSFMKKKRTQRAQK